MPAWELVFANVCTPGCAPNPSARTESRELHAQRLMVPAFVSTPTPLTYITMLAGRVDGHESASHCYTDRWMDDAPVLDAVETARGSLHVSVYPSGLLVATVRGHYGTELLPRYMRALADVAASGRAVGFHDWQEMRSYDSECRRRMTEWTIINRTRIESAHILVKHRLVAMGVATGSLLVGRNLVSAYTDRVEFEAALKRLLLKKGGLNERSARL